MAEFISNSAIRRTIQPQLRAYAGDRTRPKVRKMADFTARSAIGTYWHSSQSQTGVWAIELNVDGTP